MFNLSASPAARRRLACPRAVALAQTQVMRSLYPMKRPRLSNRGLSRRGRTSGRAAHSIYRSVIRIRADHKSGAVAALKSTKTKARTLGMSGPLARRRGKGWGPIWPTAGAPREHESPPSGMVLSAPTFSPSARSRSDGGCFRNLRARASGFPANLDQSPAGRRVDARYRLPIQPNISTGDRRPCRRSRARHQTVHAGAPKRCSLMASRIALSFSHCQHLGVRYGRR
jgi:hypothetical protein